MVMRSLIIAGMVALVVLALYFVVVAVYDATFGIIPGLDWVMGGVIPWNLGLGVLFLAGSLVTYLISGFEIWGSIILALVGILIIFGVVPLGTGMVYMVI